MRRREFATFGVAGVAHCLATAARPAAAKAAADRMVVDGAINGNPHEVTGFRQGLKEFGYIDGQNVVVDYRFAEGRSDRIAGLAAELMQLRPDVLVSIGTTVTTAIKDTTGEIPVVCFSGDPVSEGFVASLARPGGRITGVSLMQGAGGLTGKRIELLKDALPNAVRIGMIFNPDFPVAVASLGQAQEVANRRGLILLQAPVRQFDEIDAAGQYVGAG